MSLGVGWSHGAPARRLCLDAWRLLVAAVEQAPRVAAVERLALGQRDHVATLGSKRTASLAAPPAFLFCFLVQPINLEASGQDDLQLWHAARGARSCHPLAAATLLTSLLTGVLACPALRLVSLHTFARL